MIHCLAIFDIAIVSFAHNLLSGKQANISCQQHKKKLIFNRD